MEIQINNETMDVKEGTNIQEMLLSVLQMQPAGIAVAVNDKVVPKHKWETTELISNDKLLIIKACSGG